MRFSSPMTTSRFRSPISASMTTTFLFIRASDTPKFAVVVVLPTPPLPDVTVTTLAPILHFSFHSCKNLRPYRAARGLFPGFHNNLIFTNQGHFRARLALLINGRYRDVTCDSHLRRNH